MLVLRFCNSIGGGGCVVLVTCSICPLLSFCFCIEYFPWHGIGSLACTNFILSANNSHQVFSLRCLQQWYCKIKLFVISRDLLTFLNIKDLFVPKKVHIVFVLTAIICFLSPFFAIAVVVSMISFALTLSLAFVTVDTLQDWLVQIVANGLCELL